MVPLETVLYMVGIVMKQGVWHPSGVLMVELACTRNT